MGDARAHVKYAGLLALGHDRGSNGAAHAGELPVLMPRRRCDASGLVVGGSDRTARLW